MTQSYLGIEIGGTKLQIVAGDESLEVRERRRITVDPAAGAAGIRRQIEAVLPDLLAKWRPAAMAVGFGGPVAWKTGRICRSRQIVGASDSAPGEWLRSVTGSPV